MSPAGRPRSFDRDAALRKAMNVFWAKGFEGTTMVDLVEAIGVKAPSVYAAFGNKDEIFKESVTLYSSIIMEGPLKELDSPDIYSAVKNSLSHSIDLFTNPANPGSCLIMTAAINCAPESKAHEDELRQHRIIYKDMFEKRFKQAIKEGQIKPEANAKTLAEFILSLVEGMAIRVKDGANKQALIATRDIALAGLGQFFNDKK